MVSQQAPAALPDADLHPMHRERAHSKRNKKRKAVKVPPPSEMKASTVRYGSRTSAAERMLQFNVSEGLTVKDNRLFCLHCNKREKHARKHTVSKHIKSTAHKKCKHKTEQGSTKQRSLQWARGGGAEKIQPMVTQVFEGSLPTVV